MEDGWKWASSFLIDGIQDGDYMRWPMNRWNLSVCMKMMHPDYFHDLGAAGAALLELDMLEHMTQRFPSLRKASVLCGRGSELHRCPREEQIYLRGSSIELYADKHTKSEKLIRRREPTDRERFLIRNGSMNREDLETTVMVDSTYTTPRFVATCETIAEDEEVLTEWYSFAASQTPYSHQLIGAEMIYRLKRVPLWYTMRTGKTLTSIIAVKRLMKEGKVDKVIFVAPATNIWDPWAPTLEREHLIPTVLDGTLEQDTELAQDAKVILLNYERVGSRMELLFADPGERLMVVADESGYIKTPDSSRSKAMHKLCTLADRVVLLNGSPTEEHAGHIWSQMRCIDPTGAHYGLRMEDFKRAWLREIGEGKYAPKDDNAYQALISATSFRLTAAEADQFNGKDKQFRHVRISATKHILEQARNIEAGFVQDSKNEPQMISKHILAVFSYLRELCCGTDKWKQGGAMMRRGQEIDPKLVWLETLLLSNSEPLVIFTEFNDQEDRIKEMLEKHGISWAGTRTLGTLGNKIRLKEMYEDFIGLDELSTVLDYIVQRAKDFSEDEYSTEIPDGMSYRYHPLVVEWYDVNMPEAIEHYQGRLPGVKYSNRERGEQVQIFQRGEVRCFILKTREGRGISLHRLPAVLAGIGDFPSIIFMAPGWELASWEQAMVRCMVSDPRNSKSVCTTVYTLTIAGSIEEMMLGCLKRKKSFADEALQDGARDGYVSMVQELISGMENPSGETFDVQEYLDRQLCGIGPQQRLTKTLVPNKTRAKYDLKKKDSLEEFFAANPDVLEAFDRLMELVS